MQHFYFGKSSTEKLSKVNVKLQYLARVALYFSEVDFGCTSGIRTKAEQQELFDKGYSKTLDSFHLTGNAIDLVPYIDGAFTWDNVDAFKEIEEAMFIAAKILDIRGLEYGGHWVSFVDRPHWQLRNGGF